MGLAARHIARHFARAVGLALIGAAATPAWALTLPVDGTTVPTHAQLVRALGDPPQAEVRPERLQPKPKPAGTVRSGHSGLLEELVVTGGELVLTYPALGLVAVIDREDRPQPDPPLRWLRLAAPEGAAAAGPPVLRTPQGLYIGQPRPEALAAASQALRARETAPGASHVTFAAEAGHALAWMRPHYTLTLGFDGAQRLSAVHYEFKPALTRWGQWTLAGAMVVAAAALASLLRWLWQHPLGAPSLPVASASITRGVGRGLAALAGLLALGSLGALGVAAYTALNAGGQAYAGMGAFFLGMYALTGLLGAGVLWAIARKIEASA